MKRIIRMELDFGWVLFSGLTRSGSSSSRWQFLPLSTVTTSLRMFGVAMLAAVALSIYLSATGYAQTTSSTPTESTELNDQPRSDAAARAVEKDGQKASRAAYFFDEWLDGQVVMEGGTEYENVPLKYNVYHNALVTKDDNGNEQIIDDVRSFTLGPPRLANLAWFRRAKYLDNFEVVPDEQFVQVIYEGESWLVAVHQRETAQADSETSSANQPSDDPQTPTTTQYYFISPKGKASVFEPTREAALTLLKDKQETVADFIDATELDFDNVADLARLVAYYDQN